MAVYDIFLLYGSGKLITFAIENQRRAPALG